MTQVVLERCPKHSWVCLVEHTLTTTEPMLYSRSATTAYLAFWSMLSPTPELHSIVNVPQLLTLCPKAAIPQTLTSSSGSCV